MSKYLLIESRDPFSTNDVYYLFSLAEKLKKHENDVSIFLIQNGVFSARKTAKLELVSKLCSQNVSVLVDDFSLKERGILPNNIVPGVIVSSLDFILDSLANKDKVLWH